MPLASVRAGFGASLESLDAERASAVAGFGVSAGTADVPLASVRAGFGTSLESLDAERASASVAVGTTVGFSDAGAWGGVEMGSAEGALAAMLRCSLSRADSWSVCQVV